MNFKEYQEKARVTIQYQQSMKIIYPTIGLCGETGEVAEKIKKWIRDGEWPASMSEERKELIKKEIGDVLWYLAVLASDIGLDFDEIATHNIEKLFDRKKRGVVRGEGDKR